jgi:hypothetical protein
MRRVVAGSMVFEGVIAAQHNICVQLSHGDILRRLDARVNHESKNCHEGT